jgi:phosphate transport system substrate-binding protein
VNYAPSPRLKKAVLGLTVAMTSLMAGSAWADKVTLKSSDGTVNLEGDLVSFTDDNYIIRTDLGDLRIAANRVFCEGPGCPAVETAAFDVKMAGSDTIGEGLMPLMMGGFGTFLNAEARIENTANEGEFTATFVGEEGFGDTLGTYLISATRSGDAFAGLLDGTAQVGMSARRITPDEARALKAAGAGNMIDPNQERILAIDSLVVIVNNENEVSELSAADLAKIYSGQATNWSEFGGLDEPITIVTRAEDSGTFALFMDGLFGGQAPAVPAGAISVADNDAAAAYVNDNPGAIAYVGYAFQRGQKPLTIISECGIPTTPDPFSVKTEEYALFRRLYLYNRGDLSNELAQQFLGFTTSTEASNVIKQAGFIDLGIELRDNAFDSEHAQRLMFMGGSKFESDVAKEFIELMKTADRLSTTFRFRTGSSQLDPRGQLDLARLVDYVAAMPQGATVTFVGFSDDVGEFEPNRGLSKNRAESIVAALKAAGGDKVAHVTIGATGFGEIAPAACNTGDLGRSINRRVETWITMP